MEQVQTIIREKKVPVEDLNGMVPRAVVEQVSKRLDKPFTMHTHTQAWRYYKVRPQSSAVLGFQILDAKVLGPKIQVVGFFFPCFEINGGIDPPTRWSHR
jgi:hypothetical protein